MTEGERMSDRKGLQLTAVSIKRFSGTLPDLVIIPLMKFVK